MLHSHTFFLFLHLSLPPLYLSLLPASHAKTSNGNGELQFFWACFGVFHVIGQSTIKLKNNDILQNSSNNKEKTPYTHSLSLSLKEFTQITHHKICKRNINSVRSSNISFHSAGTVALNGCFMSFFIIMEIEACFSYECLIEFVIFCWPFLPPLSLSLCIYCGCWIFHRSKGGWFAWQIFDKHIFDCSTIYRLLLAWKADTFSHK